jgi:hypothetical protein
VHTIGRLAILAAAALAAGGPASASATAPAPIPSCIHALGARPAVYVHGTCADPGTTPRPDVQWGTLPVSATPPPCAPPRATDGPPYQVIPAVR